jgi:hypothetical protein
MSEQRLTKVLEIRTAQGELLGTIQIKDIAIEPVGDKTISPQPNDSKKADTAKDHEPLITDPQKRYLFRLLAEQGIENDEAHENLKKRFRVSTLKEVTKSEASREIERLVAGQKGGDNYAH